MCAFLSVFSNVLYSLNLRFRHALLQNFDSPLITPGPKQNLAEELSTWPVFCQVAMVLSSLEFFFSRKTKHCCRTQYLESLKLVFYCRRNSSECKKAKNRLPDGQLIFVNKITMKTFRNFCTTDSFSSLKFANRNKDSRL